MQQNLKITQEQMLAYGLRFMKPPYVVSTRE